MAEYGLIINVTETGIEAVSADLNRLNRQALDTAKSAGTLEKFFSKFANTIKGIVSIGAITAFANQCINTTSDMAKLTGALASVTGSMENAQAELQRIKEIATGFVRETISARANLEALENSMSATMGGETEKAKQAVSEIKQL